MSKKPPADNVPDATPGSLPPVPELPASFSTRAAADVPQSAPDAAAAGLPPIPDFGPSPDDAPAPFQAVPPLPVPPPSLPSAAPGSPAGAGPSAAAASTPATVRAAPQRVAAPSRAPVPPRRGGWFGVAALVLGVVAALLAFVPIANYGAWLIAVGGLVLGVVALTRRDRAKRVAWSGTIASAIGLVLSVVLSIVYTIGFVSAWEGSFTADPSPSATDSAEVVPALFGQTVTYDDGMQIQVGEPEIFTPSADARNAEGELALRFTVTIYNGTDADYELFPFTAVTAGAASGTIITDPANQMAGVPPVSTLAPGESVSTIEGYSFDGSGEVVYTVAPGPEYLPSRFTG